MRLTRLIICSSPDAGQQSWTDQRTPFVVWCAITIIWFANDGQRCLCEYRRRVCNDEVSKSKNIEGKPLSWQHPLHAPESVMLQGMACNNLLLSFT